MSIQPPSATEFLSMPSDPDEEETETPDLNTLMSGRMWQIPQPHALLAPLERIAESLERSTAGGVDSETHDNLAQSFTALGQSYDDLEAEHESLFGLLADVEKLVSKSTSKLANSVRDAITAWKTGVPEVPSEVTGEGPASREPADADGNPRAVPDHDADVEAWRAYAGGFELAEGINLEQMNRSQIRSMLGIPQTNVDG